jgi:hypothetical protein
MSSSCIFDLKNKSILTLLGRNMYNTENNAESDFQNKRAYTPTDRWICTLIKSDMLLTLKYDSFYYFIPISLS